MLGASIHYPLRGAVTWKSIVGTNVAADALSNLASPGVMGGALVVIGEDYGEGASVIQERTTAYALKSSLILLDPRPELGHMVRMVEDGFAMSEAANTPVMLQLRIRACHVRGSFACKDNVAPAISHRHLLEAPAAFDYGRLSHPPSTFRHEKLKTDERLPAARRFVVEHGLNEVFGGHRDDLGLIVQGGLYNSLVRALQQLGLADAFGESALSMLVLNVTYPLVPEQVADFCRGKRAVLVVEEGQPDFIEQEILAILSRRKSGTRDRGKGRAADGRGIYGRGDRARHGGIRRASRTGTVARRRPLPGSMQRRRGAMRWLPNWPHRCRPDHPTSASAVRSGPCSPR